MVTTQPRTKNWTVRIGELVFGIDLRSLALFRVAIALLILVDLIGRATDLIAHYTDGGVLPRVVLFTQPLPPYAVYPLSPWISLHMLSGSLWGQVLLFGVAGLVVIALGVGYHTRLATCVSWYLMLSLHARNLLVSHLGDELLRALLFWGMFVPLGACWSIDRMHSGIIPPYRRAYSVGTIALLGQVMAMYLCTAALKLGPEWHEGSAVYYALSMDYFVTSLGKFIRQFPNLLRVTTHVVLYGEWIGPLCLLVPVAVIRMAVVFLFILFQICLGFGLTLGLFPWVSSIAMLPFLPTWFWDQVLPQRQTLKETAHFVHGSHAMVGSPLMKSSLRINVLVGGLFGYVILSNLGTRSPGMHPLLERGAWFGRCFGLNQRWDMFATSPPRDDGWFVVPGHLQGESVVDLLTGRAVKWGKPPLISDTFKDYRWLTYFRRIWWLRDTRYPQYFAEYLCRNWNRHHQGVTRLNQLEVFYMLETTLPDYQLPRTERVLIVEQACGETDNRLAQLTKR